MIRDVMNRVDDSHDLTPERKKELLSALRTLSQCLNAAPGEIPAEPASLRKQMENAPFALAGITRKRWDKVRSFTLVALRIGGFEVMASRRTDPVTSVEWLRLVALLPRDRDRYGLSRFVSFCTAEGREPSAVEISTFQRFGTALDEHSLVRNAEWVYRQTCLFWNRAAGIVVGWPPLRVPVSSANRRYAMEWEELPVAFRVDVEEFLTNAVDQDPLDDDYRDPIRPATALNWRQDILRIATALVTPDYPASNIVSVTTLVEGDNAKRALRWFQKRAAGAKKAAIYSHASLLRNIAHRRLPQGHPHHAQLDGVCERLKPKKQVVQKNAERLRQFDEPKNVDALLGLPAHLMRLARRNDKGGPADVVCVVYALAIELLTVTALRIFNVTLLEMDEAVFDRYDAQSTVHIVIPAHKMKNDEAFELTLPPGSAALLKAYLDKWRPRLCPKPSRWVFPNARGEQRSISGFGTRVRDVIFHHTGLTVNAHLFRHLAVKFQLDAFPEDIETPKLLLGHLSSQITMDTYATTQAAAAHKRYEGVIDKLREDGRTRQSIPRGLEAGATP
jgi:integrase